MLRRSLFFALFFASTLAAETRRFIVELAPGTSLTRQSAAARLRSDAADVAVVRHEFSRAFRGAAVELRDGQSVETLRRLPYVVAVHPDREVIAFSDSWPSASRTTSRPSTQATGNGVVVAVLDTGIDGTHPALAGKVIGGHDFINDDADAADDHGHGTHVAGIIAAEGDMTGVAPGVRLLAYKVLNAEGRGTTSAVIAAIERAIDPNGDGDPSDHADVLNLSLGDRGHPNDPMARAVDNAVAAGVIVCAAAGNEERFHRIGSPASAANAITVGASTIEEGVPIVAYFTSRGPSTGNGAIKPDLLAPGRDIYSTHLHHGYKTLSGTSMATPYVAGLAALLLEEHPTWTPARVKAALVTTARAVADEEVMTQGTGIADVLRARGNTLVASPTQLNLGLNGHPAPAWSSTRRFTLRNDGVAARTLHATIEGAKPAMTMSIAPVEATLQPGQTVEFELTIDVDNTALGRPPTRSFAFGGMVVVASDEETIRLPWAFVRAARATITSDAATANILWRSEVPRLVSAVSIGSGMELLVEPGIFDFVVAAQQDEDVRLVIAEQRSVAGDVTLTANATDAPHEIRFDGVDDAGTPFPDGDGTSTLRSLLTRLVLPDERTVPLPDTHARVVHVSSFSERYALLGTEAFVDRDASRVYVAQFAAARNVDASRTLQIAPGDYARQNVELHFPASGPRRDIEILPRDWPRRPVEHRQKPPSLRFATDGATWSGTLFFTKETHDSAAGGVQLSLYTDANADFPATLMTPMIRRNERGVFATWGYQETTLPVGTVGDEVMSFGRGAIHVPRPMQATAQGLVGDAEVYGHRGDRRRIDTRSGKVRVLDEAGREIASGSITPGSFYVPLSRTGRFTSEIRFPSFAIDDRVGEALLTSRFDTTAGVASPPSITSLAVLDGAGRHATRLPSNGNASLVFSAADEELGQYRRVVESATKVFFRRRNTSSWTPLTAVATADEETGVVYRVDLRDVLRAGAGEYEIAIDIADEAGSTTRWQLAPAFIVESAPSAKKQRSVRH